MYANHGRPKRRIFAVSLLGLALVLPDAAAAQEPEPGGAVLAAHGNGLDELSRFAFSASAGGMLGVLLTNDSVATGPAAGVRVFAGYAWGLDPVDRARRSIGISLHVLADESALLHDYALTIAGEFRWWGTTGGVGAAVISPFDGTPSAVLPSVHVGFHVFLAKPVYLEVAVLKAFGLQSAELTIAGLSLGAANI